MRYVEGRLMRYLVAMALGFALIAPSLVPAESAQMVNQSGNMVVSRGVGNGGEACYVDGTVRSCDQPAPMTMYPASDVARPAGQPLFGGSTNQPARPNGGHEGEK